MIAEIPDNLVDLIVRHEKGGLTDDETISLFTILIETGLASKFQGLYGMLAKQLLCEGLIRTNEELRNAG